MPHARDLLQVWEDAADPLPARRDLALLRLTGDPQAADLPPGARNAALLALPARLFGKPLELVTDCPACGESLEFTVDPAPFQTAAQEAHRPPDPIQVGEVTLSFRLPTCRDLAELPAASEPMTARRWLAHRCILEARSADGPVPREQLSDATLVAMSQAMADADPGATLDLAVACPACAHTWTAPLDPGAVLWHELDQRARRLLAEVHALARAYGWSEPAILDLGPARRQSYLRLVAEA